MSCLDDSVVFTSTPLNPELLPIAISTHPYMGSFTIDVDSHTRSNSHSQEDNSTNQGSIAPDPCRTASANLSHSPMEYDKRFVFIYLRVVCSAAAERGRCISCSVGLFFSSMVYPVRI